MPHPLPIPHAHNQRSPYKYYDSPATQADPVRFLAQAFSLDDDHGLVAQVRRTWLGACGAGHAGNVSTSSHSADIQSTHLVHGMVLLCRVMGAQGLA